MEILNDTRVSTFVLMGLSSDPRYQIPLFVVFLMLYIVNLTGNLLMIVTITTYAGLHSPMYFFLRNLSFIDILFTSSIVPKMLVDFLSQVKSISFAGCVAQLYSFISLGGVECVLLAVMSLDRYVAVCKPLHYTMIMNRRVCMLLTSFCWAAGLLNSLAHTVFTFRLPFCKSNRINQFFCDIPPLLALSCTETHFNEIVVYTSAGSVVIGSFMLTLLSYIFIIRAILNIRTAAGRQKVSSTCISHLTVVSLFYGTAVLAYVRPASTYSLEQHRVTPVFFGVVTPMLNPIIYSLRNKEVQGVLRKALESMNNICIGERQLSLQRC